MTQGQGYQPQPQSPEEPKTVQVDIAFLQAILDYMKTKPYEEVYRFIDVLTGRIVPPQELDPNNPPR